MPLSDRHGLSALDDAGAIRHAGAELLSLALLDARNVSLRWLAALEERQLLHVAPERPEAAAPLWLIGHAGWYQEQLIARHVQRSRGEMADPASPRLPSVHPRSDEWFGRGPQAAVAGLDPETVRGYLAATMDATLELLGTAGNTDEALYVFRAALLHEDRIGHALAEMAFAEQWPLALPALPSRVDREPIWLPAQTVALGSARGGFVPENERWAHPVTVPEFEIDAQAVDWARYAPFAEDGGYDERRWWSDEGWAWLEGTSGSSQAAARGAAGSAAEPDLYRAGARRAPRHVEQFRGGVVLMRQGRLTRVPPTQPVVQVTRHEAEAWCHWAGRRLPTEPEWALAVHAAASRGFLWGDVFEWVAGSARPWPGHAPTPDRLDAMPAARRCGVLRGASWLSRGRLKHPDARRFMPPYADHAVAGFRSCSM